MSLGSFYRGTTHDQDGRYKNKEKKLLENNKFPKEFDQSIDLSKIDMRIIKSWVEGRLSHLLMMEDEFLVNYVMNMLEEKSLEPLNPGKIQINLTGFLNMDASVFMRDLWNLLLSAQASPNGIVYIIYNNKQPPEFLKEKKEELKLKSEQQKEKLETLKRLMDNNSKFEKAEKIEKSERIEKPDRDDKSEKQKNT